VNLHVKHFASKVELVTVVGMGMEMVPQLGVVPCEGVVK
jgi:hypothetical protein